MPSQIDSASLADAMLYSDTTTLIDGFKSSAPLNPGMDADLVNELYDFYDSQQYVSSIAATDTAGGGWPAGIAISTDPVFMEDPTNATVLPFVSLDLENSPSANQQLTPLDTGNTPHPTRSSMDYASTPESAATLGSKSGTSPYYMTPSSVGSLAVQLTNP